MSFGLPFNGQKKAFVIPPTDFAAISETEAMQAKEFRRLIEEHQNGIERELGCALEFVDTSAEVLGAKWLIGPSAANPEIRKLKVSLPSGPEIFIDRKHNLLVSDGTTSECPWSLRPHQLRCKLS